MASLEDRQLLYVVLAVVGQLVILLFMNYTTYQPYSQLMKALQVLTPLTIFVIDHHHSVPLLNIRAYTWFSAMCDSVASPPNHLNDMTVTLVLFDSFNALFNQM